MNKYYPSPSHFFKIACTIFRVIIFQDFAAPSLQNETFDLQTGRSGKWKPPKRISKTKNVIYLPTEHQRALGTRSNVTVRSKSIWNLEMLFSVTIHIRATCQSSQTMFLDNLYSVCFTDFSIQINRPSTKNRVKKKVTLCVSLENHPFDASTLIY